MSAKPFPLYVCTAALVKCHWQLYTVTAVIFFLFRNLTTKWSTNTTSDTATCVIGSSDDF